MVAGAGMWRELAAAFCAGEGIVVGDRVRYEIARAASACGHLGDDISGGEGEGGEGGDARHGLAGGRVVQQGTWWLGGVSCVAKSCG